MFSVAETPVPADVRRPLARRLWLPIVQGPLRGQRWCPASGGKLVRVLMGTYEKEQTALFLQSVRRGDVVLDIGAACGYYTLLAAQLTGPTGRVVSFEPDPRNVAFLQQHVTLNRLPQTTVLQLALAEQSGRARFGGGTGTGTGRLCDNGAFDVTVRRLDDIAAQLNLSPTHLKIDVEGAELQVLRGGEQTIRTQRPTLFLSLHPAAAPNLRENCYDLLARWGYDLQPILGDDLAKSTELFVTPRDAKRAAA